MQDSEDETVEDKELECLHESHDHDWLPMLSRKESLTLAPHPYCEKCGLVRNVGPDRPRKVGFYMEVLSRIEKHLKEEHDKGGKYKLTEAHKRLMVKKIQDDEVFFDLYGVMASTQEERFMEIVQEVRPDIKECVIEYYLDY